MTKRIVKVDDNARGAPGAGGHGPEFWSELLERVARDGDRESFARLFAHFAPLVKGYAVSSNFARRNQALADELVQEVMLAVWRKAHLYDRSKAAASTWIFTIARNQRIDMLRRMQRDPLAMPTDVVWEEAGDNEPYISLQRRVAEKHVHDGLKELPEEQREVLTRAYMQDKSHSEVAAELGLPLGTVKSRIRLALNRLKVGLHRHEL